MLYEFEIDSHKGVITQVFKGAINSPVVLSSLSSLVSDPKFRSHYHIITDLRNIISDIPLHELRDLAKQVVSLLPSAGRKSAFIVNSPKYSALAIIFGEVLSKSRDFKLFSTIEGAREWVEQPAVTPGLSV